LWRPAGILYLAVCLAALAVGLWPDAVYPSRSNYRPAPLPTLQTLAVGQAAFILLVHPLVLLRRRDKAARPEHEDARAFLASAVLETLGMLAATAPFYAAAAWLADATVGDVLRAALYAACLWPTAWAGAWCMIRRPRWASAVVLGLLLAALGLPAAWYVAREFLPAVGDAGWLWRLAPATFAWDNAASRLPNAAPEPLWALLAWPAIAVAVAIGAQADAVSRRDNRQ